MSSTETETTLARGVRGIAEAEQAGSLVLAWKVQEDMWHLLPPEVMVDGAPDEGKVRSAVDVALESKALRRAYVHHRLKVDGDALNAAAAALRVEPADLCRWFLREPPCVRDAGIDAVVPPGPEERILLYVDLGKPAHVASYIPHRAVGEPKFGSIKAMVAQAADAGTLGENGWEGMY